jgi:hypothetical protein
LNAAFWRENKELARTCSKVFFVRLENRNIFFYNEKCSCLLRRW